MPRTQTRARQRRARFETLCREFDRSRADPESFWDLLRRIADSDVRVWAVSEAVNGTRPLDDAELAMIAQAAAPQLVRMTRSTAPKRVEHEAWQRSQKSRP